MRRRRWTRYRYSYRYRSGNRKNRKLRLVVVMLLITGLFFLAEQQLSPIVTSLAQQKAHMAAVKAMQESAQNELLQHEEYQNYQELMYIEKDLDGRIVFMAPNTMKLNMLIASITIAAEKALSNLSEDNLKIPMGAVSGSKLFSSLGPNLSIEVTPVSAVNISIIDDFVDAGINQTRHRIWLHMQSEIGLAIPFENEIMEVETDVLLTEGIIVGPIPDTYLDLGTLLE